MKKYIFLVYHPKLKKYYTRTISAETLYKAMYKRWPGTYNVKCLKEVC